jgi:hypothetical protein
VRQSEEGATVVHGIIEGLVVKRLLGSKTKNKRGRRQKQLSELLGTV